MENIDLENCGMTIMYLSTSLCEKYDDWKNDENFTNVANLETNSICIKLKKLYPMMTDRVCQSIALAYSLYFYLLVINESNNFDKQQANNQKILLENLGIDQID